jgi:hypothetical protein
MAAVRASFGKGLEILQNGKAPYSTQYTAEQLMPQNKKAVWLRVSFICLF